MGSCLANLPVALQSVTKDGCENALHPEIALHIIKGMGPKVRDFRTYRKDKAKGRGKLGEVFDGGQSATKLGSTSNAAAWASRLREFVDARTAGFCPARWPVLRSPSASSRLAGHSTVDLPRDSAVPSGPPRLASAVGSL
nr:hypothetical protein Iba_chr14dCG4190 [Ipomoea batatas]